ncbi:hypothetical protein TrVE_jg1031 [Triparma verrucosa]|uniref:Uncharacterized protein n=1 Tax=Triparma verrucosa TaxID=1606542 RepID=A0A9W7ELX6_9STRA|nr:hypothetical protein TrVE_jg1031 [Triparma verrucosa]
MCLRYLPPMPWAVLLMCISLTACVPLLVGASDSLNQTDRPTLILPIYQFGLANRLRQLAAGVILAQELGRDLKVDWRSSEGCGSEIDALFVTSSLRPLFSKFDSPTGTDEILEALFSPNAIFSSSSNPRTKVIEVNSTTTFVSHVGMFINTDERDNSYLFKAPTVVLKINSAFFPKMLPCSDFFARKSLVYKSLVSAIQPDLAQMISGVRSSLPPTSKVIGVHVRATDPRHDWPVVAPQYGLVNASGLVQTRTGDNDDGNYNNIDNDDNDEKKSGTWEEYASTDLFLKIINEMITSDGGVGYTFLLFSNSKVIKKRIVDTFPKNTVYALNYDDDKEGLMDRASTRSVQEALVDFVLLSETDFVVHSFGSSFGEEAATINMLPSVRVRLGGSIYGVDVQLEGCNHPQIMNEVGVGQGGEVCFFDGSKEVCNNKLLKKYCAFVGEEWGLRDVYC